MLWIHVVAGLVALLAGALALIATKGSPLHRLGGRVFAVAMLVMTGSAVVMAAYLRPNIGNVLAGSLTFYLVVTGVLAVARPVQDVRAVLVGMMLVALVVGASGLLLGLRALAMPNGAIDQIPAFAYFMFGTVGSVAGLLDARLLLVGRLQGKHRLARHLWRMGYAMWVATLSFFLGQADEFPAAVRASGILTLPVLLVTLTLLYWVVRAFFARDALALNSHAAKVARRKGDAHVQPKDSAASHTPGLVEGAPR
jgi:uncharacterized membrane protein